MPPPPFVAAQPPEERWYQRLETRSHPDLKVAYTAAIPTGPAHLAHRPLFFTSFTWRGGALSRAALVRAYHALISSRAALRAAARSIDPLPRGSVHAHLAEVRAELDAAIRKS
jgi:hypothetical protein